MSEVRLLGLMGSCCRRMKPPWTRATAVSPWAMSCSRPGEFAKALSYGCSVTFPACELAEP